VTKIDIISGFLGAGKTTFASKLLAYYLNKGLTPVYIANEFGEAVIDAQVIESKGFEALKIEGGCICCSLKSSVSETVASVMDAFSPDVIVFEPSGVFVFDNFIDVVKSNELRGKCEVGNVFTIVDGVNFNNTRALYGSFIYNQIRNASILLVSKLENIKRDVNELICDIRNINPDGFLVAEIWDKLDEKWFDRLENFAGKAPNVPGRHSHALQTLTITNPRALTQKELETFIDAQKASQWGDIYRIKGLLMVDDAFKNLNMTLTEAEITNYKGYGETTVTIIGNSIEADAVKQFLEEEYDAGL